MDKMSLFSVVEDSHEISSEYAREGKLKVFNHKLSSRIVSFFISACFFVSKVFFFVPGDVTKFDSLNCDQSAFTGNGL